MKFLDIIAGYTAEQGARQHVWAALGPDGKDGPHVKPTMSGAYVSFASVQEPSDFSISREGYEVQERIWMSASELLLLCLLIYPPVLCPERNY